MSMFKVAVIGLGFGIHHIHTLANMDGVYLTAIADNNNPDLEHIGKKYGVRVYRDGLSLLENEKLDAVSICVSPKWREPLLRRASILGIPMFIEKPWASNVKQAYEFAQFCEDNNSIIMTGFSFQFLPAVKKLKELMDGELGPGWLLNGEYLFDWIPGRQHWLWDPNNGNGFFNENSCHIFDAICSLLGEPQAVNAEGINRYGSPSAEAGIISFRYDNGSLATMMVGGIGIPAFRTFPRINIITENGQAYLSGRDHVWESLTWGLRSDLSTRTYQSTPESLGKTRYTYAFQHFFDSLQTGMKPTVGIKDGLRSVKIAEAVYKSINLHQWVEV